MKVFNKLFSDAVAWSYADAPGVGHGDFVHVALLLSLLLLATSLLLPIAAARGGRKGKGILFGISGRRLVIGHVAIQRHKSGIEIVDALWVFLLLSYIS